MVFIYNFFIIDYQNLFALINIIVTVIVGCVLGNQIKSQKSIINSYKDFATVIDPKKALLLKDEEIKQIKKNLSNNINTLQNQNSELSFYVNHIIEYLENTSKEINTSFDRDSFILDNLPSCKNILNNHNEL